MLTGYVSEVQCQGLSRQEVHPAVRGRPEHGRDVPLHLSLLPAGEERQEVRQTGEEAVQLQEFTP